MKSEARWLAGFVVVAVSGCVSVQQQTATMPPAAMPRAVVAVPVPMPAHASAAGPRIVYKTVAAGGSIVLNSASTINRDCTLLGLPTGRVTQQPAHGTIRIFEGAAFPEFPPRDPRAECNRRKLPATLAEYTPAPGFTGSDFAAIDYIFKDGKDAELKFPITVK